MTEKRIIIRDEDYAWIDTTTGYVVEVEDAFDLINQLHEENEQLKQFKEEVAKVIEGKMGDNVCNDYKMEVLKEIWEELELDEVWFE